VLERAADAAARHEALDLLDLLVLHGSRARGEATARSDWDFAYLAGAGFDLAALIADLSHALAVDRVDLAGLSRSSAVLRYRAARDGVLVFERRSGLFDQFAIEAASFWCDVRGIVRDAYRTFLDELDA
jgi:predicted nucleotidyltransferase